MCSSGFGSARVFPAEVAQLDAVQAWVETVLGDAGCPRGTMVQISVIVEELFVNIASYAYEGGAGEVTLHLALEDGMFQMQFEDSGKPFNPLTHPAPNTKAPLNMRQTGGMGIHIVIKTADKIDYRREEDRNILTVQKRIQEGSP